MTPKKLKTKAVEKNDYRIFLDKAKDFYAIMRNAHEAGKPTAIVKSTH